ncbi:D-3-phosphoglycerate dehydrogenase [Bacillus sp. JCM 19045]|nr:D-3-phosphoglycerate dehydrogenase [Bacillus sp. JCM 19045]
MTATVIITDCDHEHIQHEKDIFNERNLSFLLKQCKTEEDLIHECTGATVLINQYAPITDRVLKALPTVKLVVRYGVGVNNVDLAAANAAGVHVCNVPDYGTQEVADHALALMLAFTRGVHQMTLRVKAGEWNYQDAVPLFRHQQQTIGVIGLGRIGTAFAEKVHALGCRVLVHDPKFADNKTKTIPPFVEQTSLDELLAHADVVSIHCPLDRAYHLIGQAELALMKQTAYLINVSRGGIVDETALVEALQQKEIAGAALDVFEQEPVPHDHPLLHCDQFLCTPHMAWYSEQAAIELKQKVAQEAVRFLEGDSVHYLVNDPQ